MTTPSSVEPEQPSFTVEELFAAACTKANPAEWLADEIKTRVTAARNETQQAANLRINTLRGERDHISNEARDICVEYYKDGTLCKEESIKIAERLHLDPWWGKKWSVTVPVTVTYTVEADGDLEEDAIYDLIRIEADAAYNTGEAEVDNIDVEWSSYDCSISEDDA